MIYFPKDILNYCRIVGFISHFILLPSFLVLLHIEFRKYKLLPGTCSRTWVYLSTVTALIKSFTELSLRDPEETWFSSCFFPSCHVVDSLRNSPTRREGTSLWDSFSEWPYWCFVMIKLKSFKNIFIASEDSYRPLNFTFTKDGKQCFIDDFRDSLIFFFPKGKKRS